MVLIVKMNEETNSACSDYQLLNQQYPGHCLTDKRMGK